jgi:hypothetical protein
MNSLKYLNVVFFRNVSHAADDGIDSVLKKIFFMGSKTGSGGY